MPHKLPVLLLLFCCMPVLQAQVDSTDGMKLDLGFTRGKNVYLWPVIRRIREDKTRDLQVAFTLYQNKKNYSNNTHHKHLLPVYWTDSSSKGKDFRLFTAYYPSVFRYSNNFYSGVKSYAFMEFAPGIKLLEYSKSANGDYLSNNLLFFLWYKNDRVSQTGHFITFPVYWHFHNPQQRSNVLFPVYWNFRAGEKRSSVLFPLYWQFRNPKFKSSTLFPLYSYGNNNVRQKTHLAITPLFWHIDRGSKGSSTRLYPLYYRTVYKADSSTGIQNILFPVYWSYKDKAYNNKVFFPFIWSYKNPNYQSFTAFPLMSYGISADKKRSYEIISPLYGRFTSPERRSKWFIPLFYHRVEYNHSLFMNDMQFPDTQRTTFVLPWYRSYVSRTQIRRSLFPIYWLNKTSYKDNYVIFPLIWKYDNSNSRAFAFMPFFASDKNKDGTGSFYAASCLYWHSRINSASRKGYRNVFFPVWWQGEIRNYQVLRKPYSMHTYRYNILFPVWWHFKDTARHRRASILFPFIWSIRNPKISVFTFMPFFSSGKTIKGKGHIAVTPLFWRFKKPSGSFSFIFPVWWYYKDMADKRVAIAFPLLWYRKDTRYRSFSLIPLFSYGKSVSGPPKQHRAITPLFWQLDNPGRKLSFLFPALWYKYDKTRHKSNYVAFPLLWYMRSPEKQSVSIFPLYWERHDIGKSTHLFVPLFYRHQDPYTQNTGTVLFPVYWSFKNTHDTNTIIFPFSYHSKSQWRKSYVFFPLYMNYHYFNAYKLHAVTPLYWQYKRANKSVAVFFPLYFYNRKIINGEEQRKSVVFPLYFRKKTEAQNNTVLFPLSFYYRNSERRSYTLFPLFAWRKNLLNSNRYYAVTPLFWNVHRYGAHTVHFAPLFHYKADTLHNKSFSLLYVLYRQQSGPQYQHVSFLWPLIDYNKNKVSKSFRIVPVIWYQRSESFSYHAFLPLWYVAHTPGHRQINIFWQLYTQRHDTGIARKSSYLFKSFIANRYYNKDYEYRFLYLMYAKVKKQGRREFSFFPFYYSRSDSATGNYNRAILLSVYSRFKVAVPNTNYFYREEKILWFIRLRSNYKYLKSKGINYKR